MTTAIMSLDTHTFTVWLIYYTAFMQPPRLCIPYTTYKWLWWSRTGPKTSTWAPRPGGVSDQLQRSYRMNSVLWMEIGFTRIPCDCAESSSWGSGSFRFFPHWPDHATLNWQKPSRSTLLYMYTFSMCIDVVYITYSKTSVCLGYTFSIRNKRSVLL